MDVLRDGGREQSHIDDIYREMPRSSFPSGASDYFSCRRDSRAVYVSSARGFVTTRVVIFPADKRCVCLRRGLCNSPPRPLFRH